MTSVVHLQELRERDKVVRTNPGASLIDLGHGVACLEFHSKLNSIGLDQLQMLDEAKIEVDRNFLGLVIGNQGKHFSAGANLALLLEYIENRDWKKLDQTFQKFRQATFLLRQFEKPILVACHGYTLGGGCEFVLGACSAVVSQDIHIGLPESRVGLLPTAGGCKEMLVRNTEGISSNSEEDIFAGVRNAWATIFEGKIADKPQEAFELHYLRPSETRVVSKNQLLLSEAKQRILEIVEEGYEPVTPRSNLPAVGEKGFAQFREILERQRLENKISAYDITVGLKIAEVLCGGTSVKFRWVTESEVLELEREAFLSLCGERPTRERIQHMLRTGKALKN